MFARSLQPLPAPRAVLELLHACECAAAGMMKPGNLVLACMCGSSVTGPCLHGQRLPVLRSSSYTLRSTSWLHITAQ